MIKHRISADWSTQFRLQHSLVPHVYKKYIPKLRWYTFPLVSYAKGYYSIVTHRKCIANNMINPRISAVWSTTKPIAAFSCTPRVQEVHTKAEFVHLNPGLLGLGVLNVVTDRKCIAKHMINPRISADWSTTKPISAFSCTPRLQIHTKAEVIHLTPGLLGLGVLCSSHA